MKLLRTTIVLLAIVIGVHSECTKAPKCTCSVDGDDVEVEEQVQSTEILAGAVGALSSAVVSGGGFAIWHLVKSRGPGIPDSGSVTPEDGGGREETDTKRRPPPPYHGSRGAMGGMGMGMGHEEETSFRTPNIYSAGKHDHLSHRVAGQPRNVMSVDDF